MNAQKKVLLPVVMMSVAVLNSPVASAMVETVRALDQAPVAEQRLPAAVLFQENSKRVAPEQLSQWTYQLALRVGATDPQRARDRCETISGSANGWDDSRLDC
jgi:hypothetical protein